MKRRSLRLRLFAAGASSILVALAVASAGLLLLFERHVERRMTLELEAYVRQLVSGVEGTADGTLNLARELAEPRFAEPLSGLYWQITFEPEGRLLRSRSLWDAALQLPPDSLGDGEVHRHTILGAGGASLLVVERAVTLPSALGDGKMRAAVAIDREEIHAAGRAFAADLAPFLAVLAAFLIAAAWVQVIVGLRPLDRLRQRLADVRAGGSRRLGPEFPDEVRPLASELDHLLDAQEASIARARTRAADLAHGLKTPLTVLAADAEELRNRGETEVGNEIATITDGMRRHVDRELARARAGLPARTGAPGPVRPVVEQVVGVLRRTPRGQALEWMIDVPAELASPADAQDLTEILGNVADNAVKWAAGKVRISGRREDASLVISVEDDGPGVPDERIATVLTRGGRLDEAQPGTGLGLAIVGDLAEAYGGAFTLGRSPLGGLSAVIRLPQAA